MIEVRTDDDLERELARCRADISRFTACVRKPWNEQQGSKCRAQLNAAERHLARLERLRGAS